MIKMWCKIYSKIRYFIKIRSIIKKKINLFWKVENKNPFLYTFAKKIRDCFKQQIWKLNITNNSNFKSNDKTCIVYDKEL